MKALRLNQPHAFEFIEQEQPRPAPGEVLVRVHRVGVCGSDLHAWNGEHPYVTYPRILGHEVGAEVVDANGSDLAPGERVVIEPLLSCGACYACRIGRTNCCTNLRVLGIHQDGLLRPYAALPARTVHRVPETFSYDDAAMAETLSIGLHAVRRAAVREGETVVVIGAGPIGLAVAQTAMAYGARVIILDLLETRLSLARELGCAHTINAEATDPVKAVLELTEGEGAPLVIEAVGKPETIEETVEMAANGGRVTIIGLGRQTVTFDQAIFVRKELDVRGSRNSCGEFAEAIRLMREGRVRMAPLVTHHFPFAEAIEAFRWIDAHRYEAVKSVIALD